MSRTIVVAGVFALAAVGGTAMWRANVVTMRPNLVVAAAPDSGGAAQADSIARAKQDSTNRAQPGYVVDSILPLEEEIRRFRAAVGPSVAEFDGGERSPRDLVNAFATALEHSDSGALTRLTVSAREFAYLVYPSSPYVKEPYRQPPGLLWRTIATPNESGRVRLLRRLGGQPLLLAGLECGRRTERQGENVLHLNCLVELKQPDGAIVRRRLFGSIIERHGRFKFMSLQNDI